MQDILTAVYDHWFWITMTILLMILAYCKGELAGVKRHQKFLDGQLNWLRDRNDSWMALFGDIGDSLAAKRTETEEDEYEAHL